MTTDQHVPDILSYDPVYVRASTSKRFFNYVIDIVVFYIIAFLFGFVLILVSPSSADSFSDPGFGLLDRLIGLILYALYMGLVEALFKGKSLGKLITRTRALNLDGSNISVKTAFARGLSRAVPFCAFSAFGTPCDPWQDKWTNTMVVDETQMKEI